MKLNKKCVWFGLCPLKRFYVQGRLDESWIGDYCFGRYRECVRYQMEERGEYHPDHMMPDGTMNEKLL
jgi:hypothetical protein